MIPPLRPELIDHAATHPCFNDDIQSELRRTADVIRQLQQPLLAFGDPTCRLCGESPADNNKLRAELLDMHIHPPTKPATTDGLDPAELAAALTQANATIAARNQTIMQLRETS